LHTNWASEEIEATACLWSYSTIMNNKLTSEINSSEKITENMSFLLLVSIQPDFWLYGFGFLGFWGLKNINNNEKNNENENNGIIDMILKFLESNLIGNIYDLEYADVVLCLSILYTWIFTLKTNSKSVKIMDIILGILFSISYKSKGNPQLFWVDGLLPCFTGVFLYLYYIFIFTFLFF
jgi:hypothetical protein